MSSSRHERVEFRINLEETRRETYKKVTWETSEWELGEAKKGVTQNFDVLDASNTNFTKFCTH